MSDIKRKSIGGTVRGRAATELRDRILTGRLAPGTRIDLDQLSGEFGISRTPVREALLDAIGRGDGIDARIIAEAHVLDAGAALGDWLRSKAG